MQKLHKMNIMNEKTSGATSEWLFLLIIIAVNLFLRAIYLWEYHGTEYWGNLTVDARYHYLWAKAIASGDFWGREVFFRAPLYAYFLALLYKLTSGSLLAIAIIQNLIGCCALLLTYYLARHLFGKTIAAIAAILYLFTFDFYFFESELLLDFLLVFFLPLFFLCVFRAEKTGQRYLWLIGGLILGLAAATRPTALILLLIVPLAYLRPSSKPFQWKDRASRAVILALGTAIILLPIAIRNYAVGQDFTFLPSQGGINFYIGNNPHSNGWSAAMPDSLGGAFWEYAACRQAAEKESGRSLNSSEVSVYWLKTGLAALADSPGQALALYWRKIRLLFSNADISNNRNIPQFKQQIAISNIMRFSWWLFLPLGIVGMITGIKQNYQSRIIALFILFYSITILSFFITSRFRLPMLPFWIIFSACGLQSMWRLISGRKIKKVTIFALVLIAGGLFSILGVRDTDFSNPLQEEYSAGNRLLAAGKYPEAIQKFHALLRSNPAFPQANLNLAAGFVRLGQLDSAEYYYLRELEVNPDSALPLSNLAEIKRLAGRPQEAWEYARTALEQRPYFIEVLINYIKAARESGHAGEALTRVNSLEKQFRADPYYHYYRGILKIDLAQADLRLLDSAYHDLQQSLRLFEKESQPTYDRDPGLHARLLSTEKKEDMIALAWANLGIINLNRGDNLPAQEAFTNALQFNASLSQARQGLLEAYIRTGAFQEALDLADKLLESANQSQRAYCLLYRAQALYNLGDREQAVRTLEQLIAEYPDHESAKRILAAIKTGGS